MRITKASEAQLRELASLERMYMEFHVKIDKYYAFEDDMTTKWIAHMRKFLRYHNNLTLVALEGEKIIGYMTASVVYRTPIYKMKRTGLIGDIFVLADHRRKGVFTKLLNRTVKWMKSKGIQYVVHPISFKNEVARVAFDRNGFEDFTVWVRKKI